MTSDCTVSSSPLDAALHLRNGGVVEAVSLEVRETPVGLAEIGSQSDAFVVGGDGIVIATDRLEQMAESDQRADVLGAQRKAALIRFDGFVCECRRGERGSAQEMRLRIGGVERDGTIEALERIRVSILLPCGGGRDREWRRGNRARVKSPAAAGSQPRRASRTGSDQRQEPHRIDVARIVTQDAAIQVLGLLEPSLLLVFCGQRHHAALRRQLEAALEGLVGFGAATEHRESLAEREPCLFELRVEMRGALQVRQCFRRAILLHEQIPQVLVRLGERRGVRDRLLQGPLRLSRAVELDQQRTKQRKHVDVTRIGFECAPAARFGCGEVTGVDQPDRLVEKGFRCDQGTHGVWITAGRARAARA